MYIASRSIAWNRNTLVMIPSIIAFYYVLFTVPKCNFRGEGDCRRFDFSLLGNGLRSFPAIGVRFVNNNLITGRQPLPLFSSKFARSYMTS
jgi:hypothetical protein